MAKYDVTYACKHAGVVDLLGKNTARQSRLAYLETTLCPECYANQQAAKVGGEWVEMHYSEYKTNYAGCTKRSYNPQTKTIQVLVPAKPDVTAELRAAGLPDGVIALALEGGSDYVRQQLADAIAKYPNPQGRAKEGIDGIAAALAILVAHGK